MVMTLRCRPFSLRYLLPRSRTAAIAYCRTFLVMRSKRQDSSRFTKPRSTFLGRDVRRVIPGMMGAAEYQGPLAGTWISRLASAGKTGSCVDRGLVRVGLFASVAPIESGKYAVAVITRGQHERGKYAAAVAADVYRSLAGYREKRP